MSFTHLGNRGTANSKTNAATFGGVVSLLSLNPNQTIPVGSFIVVWGAWDSQHVANGEGDTVPWNRACFDDAGNTYVTVAGRTHGSNNGGASIVIFVAEVHYAITTSSSIFTHAIVGTSGQVAPRAMSVHEFSVDSDKLWAAFDDDPVGALTTAGDPITISWSGGQTGREYLILHGMAAEGPNTDAYTWDSDYTQISGDGTTGGADDTNIHVRGGFRIATITSDSVDVTSTTADRDYAQVIQAITEIGSRRALSFPRNPTILDDFNRADENPVDGGLWDTSTCSPRSSGGTTRHLRTTSNQLRSSSASPGLGGSWYDGTTFGDVPVCDGFDAFMTFAVADQATLSMRGSGCTETATADGIAVEYIVSLSATSQFIASPHLAFGSLGNAGRTDQVRGRASLVLSNGWKVGLQMVRVDDAALGVDDENYIYYWVDKGSGWEVVFAIHGWSGIFDSYDGTTRVKVGVGIDASGTRIDDVGGGPTEKWCSSPFKPQIYRRAYGYR